MMRLLTFLSLFAAAAAWTTGSAVSSFGGSVLISSVSNGASLEMKKGKPNVPPQMRGQYKKQMEMAEMREQMISASQPGDDGMPVFNLFVRTKLANVWYPCGSFKGDDRSAALAKSWADGGLLSGISKKQLDGGIAGSLARDLEKLKETVVRAYPQLKKSKDNFEFGYKLGYEGLSMEQSTTVFIVEPKEQTGFLDGIKTIFS